MRPPAGTSHSPWPPPHLLDMRSSTHQLLPRLPDCKSKALLPTSVTWNCEVRMHAHSVDTVFTSTFMTRQNKSCYRNRSATVVFCQSPSPNITHTTALPRKHYLNSKTYHRFLVYQRTNQGEKETV